MRSVSDIRDAVTIGADEYNRAATTGRSIRRVELFGSYAQGTQSDGSDVDLLVEFETPEVSLFTMAEVLDLMEGATGMEVDLVQLPLPQDTLLEVGRTVPLYEAA